MRLITGFFVLCFFSLSVCYANEETWQDGWVKGLQLLEEKQYAAANEMISMAIDKMTQEEIEKNPSILISRAQINFEMKNYDESITDCEKIIHLKNSTDEEKLVYGNMIVSAFWQLGKESEATDAYLKYITKSTLLPRYNFGDKRIIISNLPDNEIFKRNVKKFFISKFCNTERNLHDYGSIFVIDVQNNCSCDCTQSAPEPCLGYRSPEAIRGCCNTCNTLAVGASAICSTLPQCTLPTAICKLSCIMFVEAARQTCEWCCYNGGIGQNCWENFKTWKHDYHDEHPECPHP